MPKTVRTLVVVVCLATPFIAANAQTGCDPEPGGGVIHAVLHFLHLA